jgi:hypothetical protein
MDKGQHNTDADADLAAAQNTPVMTRLGVPLVPVALGFD